MQKYVQYIAVLFIAASITACGGSEATTAAAIPYYDYVDPQTLSLAPANTHMGGAVQGGGISTKPSDYSYSVSTFTGIAGSAGFSNYSTTNGPPATFNNPTDITTDGTNFYVADYANYAIRQVTSSGVVTTLSCTTDGVTPTSFNLPFSLAISPDGTHLYVVDAGSNTIRFIEIATNIVTTVGSTEGLAGSVDVKVVSPATTADVTLARFNRPTGITTDGENLYVTDSGNSTIRRINIATKAVTTLAGTSGAVGSADGLPRDARFNLPQRITTDRTSLYVTDFNNRTIRRIDISTGIVSTLAGTPGPLDEDAGAIDGIGAAARFNQPNGITTDGINLYVTDKYQNTIRKIVISTGEVTTIGGIAKTSDDETIGIGGAVDSPGVPTFYTPMGITTDGASLFVADTYNHTIRKMQ
jgi:YVTN family beta-propeller protein